MTGIALALKGHTVTVIEQTTVLGEVSRATPHTQEMSDFNQVSDLRWEQAFRYRQTQLEYFTVLD